MPTPQLLKYSNTQILKYSLPDRVQPGREKPSFSQAIDSSLPDDEGGGKSLALA
ncbi:MAG TPA: hypothetical protein PKA00_22985 [Saprospiraceae bacterium]|nr:hypothetical protein [Saprospiraceae bacterium]